MEMKTSLLLIKTIKKNVRVSCLTMDIIFSIASGELTSLTNFHAKTTYAEGEHEP